MVYMHLTIFDCAFLLERLFIISSVASTALSFRGKIGNCIRPVYNDGVWIFMKWDQLLITREL
jgi:hypothetical protein